MEKETVKMLGIVTVPAILVAWLVAIYACKVHQYYSVCS